MDNCQLEIKRSSFFSNTTHCSPLNVNRYFGGWSRSFVRVQEETSMKQVAIFLLVSSVLLSRHRSWTQHIPPKFNRIIQFQINIIDTKNRKTSDNLINLESHIFSTSETHFKICIGYALSVYRIIGFHLSKKIGPRYRHTSQVRKKWLFQPSGHPKYNLDIRVLCVSRVMYL
jgi:hypothetical protein